MYAPHTPSCPAQLKFYLLHVRGEGVGEGRHKPRKLCRADWDNFEVLEPQNPIVQ